MLILFLSTPCPPSISLLYCTYYKAGARGEEESIEARGEEESIDAYWKCDDM
jgi:hypothetical protein